MKTDELTKVSIHMPTFRGLFLFQTRNQFLLIVAGLVLGYLVIEAIPGLRDSTRSSAFTGMVIAALCWLVTCLPASFEWKLASPNARVNAQARMAEWVKSFGYVTPFGEDSHELGGPPWTRLDSNRVSVKVLENTLQVRGPAFIVRRLRRFAANESR